MTLGRAPAAESQPSAFNILQVVNGAVGVHHKNRLIFCPAFRIQPSDQRNGAIAGLGVKKTDGAHGGKLSMIAAQFVGCSTAFRSKVNFKAIACCLFQII